MIVCDPPWDIPSVVGINLPTFVERTTRSTSLFKCVAGVVGINLPTFVERHQSWMRATRGRSVSSGLTSRPSLSASPACGSCRAARVSSGLTSRPSLSGHPPNHQAQQRRVSSGLTSRPSLSVCPQAARPREIPPVSSGLTSRPSLSARLERLARRAWSGCRRD